VDLSVDEKRWFEEWRSKQVTSGVEIDNPWGATILEGLLYQEKNRGLREVFFKEEHLAQIRDLHRMLLRLVPDILDRLRQDAAEREQARRSDAVARQEDELALLVHEARESYRNVVAQAASAAGFPGRQPGHWEVVIRPSWIPAHDRIGLLKECWSIIERSHVRSNGWEYPVMDHIDRQSGQDWVGTTRVYHLDVESWRFSLKGLFAHFFPIWDDVQESITPPSTWPWDLPRGFTPQHFLSIDVAIRTFTHIFRFAGRLAAQAFDPSDGTVEVTIGMTGIRNRVLMTWDDLRRMRDCYRATEPALQNTWPCPRQELTSTPGGFAVKAALWFFERFGWHEVSAEMLSRIQARIFPHH
jgi:hypothetical protein